ncbi:hypothetical protein F0224_17600 [Vibrio coralliilyticus]|uniref:ABC-three component system protein n=1 Tax=Vibrio coralliilyticus TaxID=190893 RepID=UPI000BAC1E1A|nr:ABC-three component system protein [Vibrio coralliilyticus]NOI77502.1 hypothetical protein [Vibrio coralliilyticus]PAW02547.1 hypothetical protein CKJ79_15100 [Vibrio coralliilyticus]
MDKDFIFYQQREKCRDLVLFVHGFTGDAEETWCNAQGASFASLLLEHDYVKETFDVASYDYFTTLFDLFAKAKEKTRWIKSIIRKKDHVKERNLDINELSNTLSSHLRFTLSQYDNIYVIAHSMGGLVTKNLIVSDLRKLGDTKIKLFISLAVPHQGASLSVLGGIISDNLQISNLSPVGEFINKLNQKWIDLDSKPTTKYFYGAYDKIVTKYSSIAIDNKEKDVVSIRADHNSISKPTDINTLTCNSISQFIIDEHKCTTLNEKGYLRLPEEENLSNELFVLKLIVADIAEETQDNAKELFFNAEYVRKLFNTNHDRKQFLNLYDNVRQLYKDSYDNYLADSSVNSGMLLAEVHSKITSEDSSLLKTLLPTLQTYHKKGMLHQMANNNDYDIWWSKDRDVICKKDIEE